MNNLFQFVLSALEPAASWLAWLCIEAKGKRETARELARWNQSISANRNAVGNPR